MTLEQKMSLLKQGVALLEGLTEEQVFYTLKEDITWEVSIRDGNDEPLWEFHPSVSLEQTIDEGIKAVYDKLIPKHASMTTTLNQLRAIVSPLSAPLRVEIGDRL